jgi:hypothetical protein
MQLVEPMVHELMGNKYVNISKKNREEKLEDVRVSHH